MIVEYSSNNSGGGWWLTDQNWLDLEKAGWKVDWYKDQKKTKFSSYPDGRWLGALATSATKEFDSIEDAENEFQKITGEDPNAAGCECCGQPHSFYERN